MVREGVLAYGSNHLVLPVAQSGKRAGASSPPAEVESGVRGQESEADDGGVGAEAGEDADVGNPSPSPSLLGRGIKKKKHDPEHIVGTFRRMDAGFGFVRPEGTQRHEGRDADIFIPANAAGDAASGDTVSVKMSGRVGRGGKTEGRIIDVVSRATNRFVGTYFEQGGMGMVQVDGKVFTQPVYVGDPGAKGVQPDDKIVIEMVRFPSQARDGEGVIVEVLGNRGLPGIDTLSIMHEYGLPGPFADDTLEDARLQAEKFDESIGTESSGRHRQDLTGETIITIDPATARDFAHAQRQRPLGAWRAHRRRVAFCAAEVGARSRGEGSGDQRVFAGPGDSHVAGGDLEQPGELAARSRAVCDHGADRVCRRRRADWDRRVQERDQEPTPVCV
jgi:ribonuclease R